MVRPQAFVSNAKVKDKGGRETGNSRRGWKEEGGKD